MKYRDFIIISSVLHAIHCLPSSHLNAIFVQFTTMLPSQSHGNMCHDFVCALILSTSIHTFMRMLNKKTKWNRKNTKIIYIVSNCSFPASSPTVHAARLSPAVRRLEHVRYFCLAWLHRQCAARCVTRSMAYAEPGIIMSDCESGEFKHRLDLS